MNAREKYIADQHNYLKKHKIELGSKVRIVKSCFPVPAISEPEFQGDWMGWRPHCFIGMFNENKRKYRCVVISINSINGIQLSGVTDVPAFYPWYPFWMIKPDKLKLG